MSWMCNGELLAPVQAPETAVSREESGLLPCKKAPFQAVSSFPSWKAPPELVLQVSSFCLFWETDFSIERDSDRFKTAVYHIHARKYTGMELSGAPVIPVNHRGLFAGTKGCSVPAPCCLPHKRFSFYFILVLSYLVSLVFWLKPLFAWDHTDFLSLLPAQGGRCMMLAGVT